MAFCGKCGAQLEDGVAFCPQCGAPTGAAPVQGTPLAAQSDAEQNKAMGILAYLGFLCLVPIFAAKDSKFARFHANQGLVLLIAEVVYGIVVAIISNILWGIVWGSFSGLGMYGVVSAVVTILGILWIAFGVLAVLGIINAAGGKEKPLPIIGKITILK